MKARTRATSSSQDGCPVDDVDHRPAQRLHPQMNLPNDAKGIDGIFRTRTGVLVPYQVKFRSQRAYLTYTQIAPFLGLTEIAAGRPAA